MEFTIKELVKYIEYLIEQNDKMGMHKWFYNKPLDDLIKFMKSIEQNGK
jgi:hypothetical protein